MRIRLAVGMVAAGLCLAGVRLAWSSKDDAAPPQTGATAIGPGQGFAGTASCSASNCHGRPEPAASGVQQNEYTFCLANDKHMRAYEVLYSNRAKMMAENLAKAPGAKKIEAHLDERCLACHSTPQAAKLPAGKTEPDATLLSWQQGGVSCEACHGPALQKDKPWLAEHTSPKWKTLQPQAKTEYGMNALSDQAVQAQVCAGCHVGSAADSARGIPVRDLNHDLMAAGHPRLTFELSSFRANLPAHWNAKDKKVSDADTLVFGRVASARAALELLAHRAEQAQEAKKTPGQTVRWPEFAEYRCFACHADFNEHWRLRERDPNRPPGALPYDPWHNTLLSDLTGVDVRKNYDALVAAMAKPDPDEKTVIQLANSLRQSLDTWLKNNSGKTGVAASLKDRVKAIPRTWEETTQLALAVAALQPTDRATLVGLFEALSYPAGSESPAGFLGPPAARKPVQDAFSQLLELMKK